MPPRFRRPSLRTAVSLALVAWLLAVAVGFRSLLAFAYTPGADAAAPAAWPLDRGDFPAGRQSLLLMFVHPQCACSRASIRELARLMALANGALAARVMVYLPAGMPAGWEQTDLWHAAAAIPGVTVSTDPEGRNARAFDARISGDTQVFGPNRALAFSGGLTIARGHEGNSAGHRAILAHLARPSNRLVRTPVFGCFLLPATETEVEAKP